jgi:hypothetical protein
MPSTATCSSTRAWDGKAGTPCESPAQRRFGGGRSHLYVSMVAGSKRRNVIPLADVRQERQSSGYAAGFSCTNQQTCSTFHLRMRCTFLCRKSIAVTFRRLRSGWTQRICHYRGASGCLLHAGTGN